MAWGVGVVVVFIFERVFVICGEVVVAAGALVSGGGDQDQVMEAINQQAGPAEMS